MASAQSVPTTKYVTVPNGVRVFYREAGSRENPTFLLLHGFPTSSNQFRHLITLLSGKYHILAPDLPGFGFTSTPSDFKHSFANIADTISLFLDALKIQKFAIYIFDYGAPTGLRLGLKRPHDILAIVSQNGNAYKDGLGDFWNTIQPLWQPNPTQQILDETASNLLSLAGTKWQYETGVPDVNALDPAAYTLDQALLERPGQKEIQLGLFIDYADNLALYPDFHRWFRESNVPVLAIWGKNDLIFVPPGAEAYKRDSKNVEVKFVDSGHFALETHVEEIAGEILQFFVKYNI
jgi:pimeloyl-ACP methyl ester carboxylesterase